MTEPTEGTDSVPVAADDPAPATGTEPTRVPVRKRRSRPAKPKTAAAATAAPEPAPPLEPPQQPRKRLTIGAALEAKYPQLSRPLRPAPVPGAGTTCNLAYLNEWVAKADAVTTDACRRLAKLDGKVHDRLRQSNARVHARLDAFLARRPVPPLEDGWVPWPEEATT